ncbi:MAG: hypothetical protein WBX15_11125 [Thermoanaerobaculia bacterium]
MLENQIRQLADRKETEGPFLSLYIDTQRNDESQRDRIRLFIKHEIQKIRDALGAEAGGDGGIEKGIRRIEEYFHSELEPGTRGVAMFYGPNGDFFLPLQLPVQVTPSLFIGSRPHLRQLVELQEDHPPIAVAMIDAKSARLFELELARILWEIDLEHPDLPRGKKPRGSAQYANAAHVQEHFQDHVDRHQKEVAEILTRICEQDRVRGVILSGQERNVANFRSFLPKRVESSIFGTLRLDMNATITEVISECNALIRNRAAGALSQRLDELENHARGNGRGAFGISRVADAVNQRKLEELFVARGTETRGWRCPKCGIVGHTMSLGCPVCGEQVVTVDLIEEFISAAMLEDGEVTFAPAGTVLDRHDGVGAILRF